MIILVSFLFNFLLNQSQGKARYRRPNIAEFAEIVKKNLHNFTILSLNTSFANITDFCEIYITNDSVGVINDVILMIWFLWFIFFNLHLIEFGVVFNSTHLGDSLHSNLL